LAKDTVAQREVGAGLYRWYSGKQPRLDQECSLNSFTALSDHLELLQALLILWRTIEDHDTLFVMAEVAHFVGIGLLGFKMCSKRSAAGTCT
jgi:hypothetical protein